MLLVEKLKRIKENGNRMPVIQDIRCQNTNNIVQNDLPKQGCNKKYTGSGSGGKRNKIYRIEYDLQCIEDSSYSREKFKKTDTKYFNKPQLIGKLIFHNKYIYRIIRKSKKRYRY